MFDLRNQEGYLTPDHITHYEMSWGVDAYSRTELDGERQALPARVVFPGLTNYYFIFGVERLKRDITKMICDEPQLFDKHYLFRRLKILV